MCLAREHDFLSSPYTVTYRYHLKFLLSVVMSINNFEN